MPRKRRVEGAGSGFIFLAATPSGRHDDAETRRIIRSKAMQEYRKKTKKETSRTFEIMVPTSQQIIQNPPWRPFAQCSISIDDNSLEVAYHVYDDTCGINQAMRDIGYFNCIQSETELYIVLSTNAWHLSWLRGQKKSTDTVLFHSYANKAIESINSLISCSQMNATLMAGILGFAVQQIVLQDHESFIVHMNGFESLVRAAGGIGVLRHNPMFRLLVFWVDTIGAAAQDVKPRFPLPADLLPHFPPSTLEGEASSIVGFEPLNIPILAPAESRISLIFSDMKGICSMISSRVDTVWQETLFPSINIPGMLADEAIHEASRLACILFLHEIRRSFRHNQIPSRLYVQKLTNLLQTTQLEDWGPYKVLQVWVLVVTGVFACSYMPDSAIGDFYARKIVNLMKEMNLIDFVAVLQTAKSFLWVDRVFAAGIPVLQAFVDRGSRIGIHDPIGAPAGPLVVQDPVYIHSWGDPRH